MFFETVSQVNLLEDVDFAKVIEAPADVKVRSRVFP